MKMKRQTSMRSQKLVKLSYNNLAFAFGIKGIWLNLQ